MDIWRRGELGFNKEGESEMRYISRELNLRAVSPVIGVILMVAITVVLAGLLWAMIQFNPAETNSVYITATAVDKSFGWEVTVTGISQNSFDIEDLKVQMIDRENVMIYQLTPRNCNPLPFLNGLSKIYPMTLNSTVLDSTTTNVIDENSQMDDYMGCYIAYIDEDADNKVNEGDVFIIYKDFTNDGNNDIFPSFKFRIIIDDDLAMSRIL